MINFKSTYPSNDIHVNTYKPTLLRITKLKDKRYLEDLFASNKISIIKNEIYNQLQELIKCINPSIKIKDTEYPHLIDKHIKGKNLDEYGVWVYYPWNQQLVHILDEEEFVEVRTNRNKYKITNEEQNILKNKKIGIIGLSVGQSIALTMAMERTFGEIRLADFDTAELSNLNRIRTGVHNLGLKKTVIAAREIAEIDPFLNIKIFSEGINDHNINDFFLEGGKLDLLIEVCDGLDIKILSRFKAKELNIPVIMDTNDRGMIDIERFDLEPKRKILHGRIESFFQNGEFTYSDKNRSELLNSILSVDSLSERMKTSMSHIGKTINTWPQLASSVVLGGAITTDTSRRILLNQLKSSGRYYIDLDNLIK